MTKDGRRPGPAAQVLESLYRDLSQATAAFALRHGDRQLIDTLASFAASPNSGLEPTAPTPTPEH